VVYRGQFYSDDEWERRERRREQYRASKERQARGESRALLRRGPNPTSGLVVSVASLYAMGLTPKEIAGRLGLSTTSVVNSLRRLMTYWSAASWWDAAHLEWQSATGESVA
jgi:DNA-binding NarL/FixJ family response regulator